MSEESLHTHMIELGRRAKLASRQMALVTTVQKDAVLNEIAHQLRFNAAKILQANKKDLARAQQKNVAEAMLDRLSLNGQAIENIAQSVEQIAQFEDPVGQVIKQWQQPNGLRFERRRVPLGVIGIIYESRPNVTADAAALCVKAGNAVILRGGSESIESNLAIYAAIRKAFEATEMPISTVQMVQSVDRQAVGMLLQGLEQSVDLIVPRGGKGLIQRVQDDAKVPVMGHLEGICHVYVHHSAQMDMASGVVLNAKMRRTGICGAAETLLLDQALSTADQRRIVVDLIEAGCAVKGDSGVCHLDDRVLAAAETDWGKEFLGPTIAVKVIDGVDQAIAHIQTHGSGHTESILAEEGAAVERFLNQVDSAIVMHNASTQFADGGEFGMGAEIGIATGKLHARGPVGVEQLTSYKYLVRGNGHLRE